MNINQWKEKEMEAKYKSKGRKNLYKKILIEVAAQHPLKKGKFPGEEYAKRLDIACELMGEDVYIYLPGSLHIPDEIQLCEAGKEYLLKKGVPEDRIIIIEDEVYNSTDECEVASRILIENEFAELICIYSPAQLMRKALSYISFGVYPSFRIASCEELFHSYVEEAIRNIPILLNGGEGLEREKKRLYEERKLKIYET
jgi:response regulator receiver protein